MVFRSRSRYGGCRMALGITDAGYQDDMDKVLWCLVSSGYCFLLMGLFYYLIDYKGYNKNITWLESVRDETRL